MPHPWASRTSLIALATTTAKRHFPIKYGFPFSHALDAEGDQQFQLKKRHCIRPVSTGTNKKNKSCFVASKDFVDPRSCMRRNFTYMLVPGNEKSRAGCDMSDQGIYLVVLCRWNIECNAVFWDMRGMKWWSHGQNLSAYWQCLNSDLTCFVSHDLCMLRWLFCPACQRLSPMIQFIYPALDFREKHSI